MLAIFRTPDDREPLVLDATLEATHTRSAETTTSPVEIGADVVDHRRVQPEVYRFAGVVVNEPYDEQAAGRRMQGNLGNRDDPLAAVRENAEPIDQARASALMNDLIVIHDTHAPVTIETDLGRLENVVMESLETRPAGRGAIQVSGSFRVIRFASTAFSALVLPREPEVARTTPKKDLGGKATKPVESESVLKHNGKDKMKEWGGGVLRFFGATPGGG